MSELFEVNITFSVRDRSEFTRELGQGDLQAFIDAFNKQAINRDHGKLKYLADNSDSLEYTGDLFENTGTHGSSIAIIYSGHEDLYADEGVKDLTSQINEMLKHFDVEKIQISQTRQQVNKIYAAKLMASEEFQEKIGKPEDNLHATSSYDNVRAEQDVVEVNWADAKENLSSGESVALRLSINARNTGTDNSMATTLITKLGKLEGIDGINQSIELFDSESGVVEKMRETLKGGYVDITLTPSGDPELSTDDFEKIKEFIKSLDLSKSYKIHPTVPGEPVADSPYVDPSAKLKKAKKVLFDGKTAVDIENSLKNGESVDVRFSIEGGSKGKNTGGISMMETKLNTLGQVGGVERTITNTDKNGDEVSDIGDTLNGGYVDLSISATTDVPSKSVEAVIKFLKQIVESKVYQIQERSPEVDDVETPKPNVEGVTQDGASKSISADEHEEGAAASP